MIRTIIRLGSIGIMAGVLALLVILCLHFTAKLLYHETNVKLPAESNTRGIIINKEEAIPVSLTSLENEKIYWHASLAEKIINTKLKSTNDDKIWLIEMKRDYSRIMGIWAAVKKDKVNRMWYKWVYYIYASMPSDGYKLFLHEATIAPVFIIEYQLADESNKVLDHKKVSKSIRREHYTGARINKNFLMFGDPSIGNPNNNWFQYTKENYPNIKDVRGLLKKGFCYKSNGKKI